MISRYSIILVVGFVAVAAAFSFSPQNLATKQCNIQSHSALPMQSNDDDELQRRSFLSKVVATTITPILLSSTQASAAVANEPTKIELTVDTEYLVRVLEYFDGDMRKVLGVLVKAPQTTVEIYPPQKGTDPKLTPEEQLLRALYSYDKPEDYVDQASWLKLQKSDKGFIDFFTKKRWKISLPSIGSGGEKDGQLEVSVKPNSINFSNLELGAAAVVASYPLGYALYNYEQKKEEEAAALKKKQMAAKKAAKAKAAAAKKSKGTPKEEDGSLESSEVGEKQPPAIKGQENSTPKKKVNRVQPKVKDTSPEESVEDKVAQAMIDSQRQSFIAATEEEKRQQTKAEQDPRTKKLEDQQVYPSVEQQPNTAQTSSGAYLDKLSPDAEQTTPPPQKYTGSNLRSLVQDIKPKRGPNNYLDSL